MLSELLLRVTSAEMTRHHGEGAQPNVIDLATGRWQWTQTTRSGVPAIIAIAVPRIGAGKPGGDVCAGSYEQSLQIGGRQAPTFTASADHRRSGNPTLRPQGASCSSMRSALPIIRDGGYHHAEPESSL